MIKFNCEGAGRPDINTLTEAIEALKTLKAKSGEGAEFTGWMELPAEYPKTEEYRAVKEVAAEIRENAQVLIVIGIGGSYLGARAAIEMLKSSRHNQEPGNPEVYFLGNGLDAFDIYQVLRLCEGKSVYVNVISKSGTTLEPALGFRIIREYMYSRYSAEECRQRIIATTDKARGVLKGLADEVGYRTFVVPDDIGGRYSVLTPVGLLPMAAAGIDIDKVMDAAAKAQAEYSRESSDNPALLYAAVRETGYRRGKTVEIQSYPGESMRFMAEWWKQLYGESEGKGRKGIFPASCQITADLHSLGQFIQDGEPIIQESMVRFEEPAAKLEVKATEANEDGLNYVAGKDMNQVLLAAQKGTMEAHIAGGVPVMEIVLDRPDEATFGEMVLFYEIACGISCYMQNVNPFNQPGVEDYKKNMFRLLGKK